MQVYHDSRLDANRASAVLFSGSCSQLQAGVLLLQHYSSCCSALQPMTNRSIGDTECTLWCDMACCSMPCTHACIRSHACTHSAYSPPGSQPTVMHVHDRTCHSKPTHACVHTHVHARTAPAHRLHPPAPQDVPPEDIDDAKFLEALVRLKKQDPQLYNPDFKLFDDPSEDDDDDEADEGDAEEEGGQQQGAKRSKPLYLKDVIAKQVRAGQAAGGLCHSAASEAGCRPAASQPGHSASAWCSTLHVHLLPTTLMTPAATAA